MKNIVLIGLMGSGKTTVGRMTAEKLNKTFVDIDEIIETESQMTINYIFQEYGEGFFRDLESNAIEKISEKSDLVISTGGGAVERGYNLEYLKLNGIVFYLKASPAELYERIKNSENRPLLKNDNPLETLEKLLEKREIYYNNADVIINTDGKQSEEVVKEIIENFERL